LGRPCALIVGSDIVVASIPSCEMPAGLQNLPFVATS
jgi:hypothetical protein